MCPADRLVIAGAFLDKYVTQRMNRYRIYPTNNTPYIVCT